jgi:hypothetical protein
MCERTTPYELLYRQLQAQSLLHCCKFQLEEQLDSYLCVQLIQQLDMPLRNRMHEMKDFLRSEMMTS